MPQSELVSYMDWHLGGMWIGCSQGKRQASTYIPVYTPVRRPVLDSGKQQMIIGLLQVEVYCHSKKLACVHSGDAGRPS